VFVPGDESQRKAHEQQRRRRTSKQSVRGRAKVMTEKLPDRKIRQANRRGRQHAFFCLVIFLSDPYLRPEMSSAKIVA
jgi:hypothetical protein